VTNICAGELQLIDCEQTYQSATIGTITQSTGIDVLAILVHCEDRYTVGMLSVITHLRYALETVGLYYGIIHDPC
jgi:hypothetical protein